MNIAVGQHYTHRRLRQVWRVTAVRFEEGRVLVELQDTTGNSRMTVTPDSLEAYWEARTAQLPTAVVMGRGMQSYSVYCGCGETGTCATKLAHLLCPRCGVVWALPERLPLSVAHAYEATSMQAGEIELDLVPPALEVPDGL